jgi:solute carrier family 50 protein (sugar transporter)
VKDPFIAVPNAVGAVFGLIQLGLLGVFPSRK